MAAGGATSSASSPCPSPSPSSEVWLRRHDGTRCRRGRRGRSCGSEVRRGPTADRHEGKAGVPPLRARALGGGAHDYRVVAGEESAGFLEPLRRVEASRHSRFGGGGVRGGADTRCATPPRLMAEPPPSGGCCPLRPPREVCGELERRADLRGASTDRGSCESERSPAPVAPLPLRAAVAACCAEECRCGPLPPTPSPLPPPLRPPPLPREGAADARLQPPPLPLPWDGAAEDLLPSLPLPPWEDAAGAR